MDMLDPVGVPFIAKITGKTDVSGVWYYDWEEYQGQYNSVSRVQASPGRQGSDTISPAFEINNLEVDVDTFVVMYARGFVKGQLSYEFVAPDGSASGLSAGTIIGATWDGASATTIDASMATLRVDTRDGLSLANVSAGVDLLTIADASAIQSGIMNTGAQVIKGDKRLICDYFYLSDSSSTVNRDHKVIVGANAVNIQAYYDDPISSASDVNASLDLSCNTGDPYARIRLVENNGFIRYVAVEDDAFVLYDGTLSNIPIRIVSSLGTRTSQTHTDVFGNVWTIGILTTAASAYNLDNLSDVTAPTPSNLDVLQWNGSAWVNVPASGLVTTATVADGDKGDITVSGSGATWTIDNDVVTYAKLQNVSATSRILGRKTAGAGDTEECTLSEVLDFVGSAAQGDILYRGATTWARLGAGTAGYVLQTGGAGANPSWVAAGSSYTDEQARDAVAASLVEGLGMDISTNDGADTTTYTRQYLGGRAYRSTNQTISNATYTAVSFSTTSFGSTFYSGGSPTKLTVPSGKDGFYRIHGHIRWDTFSSRIIAYLYKNGSEVLVYSDCLATTSSYQSQDCDTLDYLAAGDYIELFVYQGSGSSRAIFGAEYDAFLELDFIGI